MTVAELHELLAEMIGEGRGDYALWFRCSVCEHPILSAPEVFPGPKEAWLS